MATLEFAPLFRTTVGFDRVLEMLAHALARGETNYPPCNIEKCGKNDYRIALAVAGFAVDDLEVVTEQSRLTIRGRQRARSEGDFLYHGIAARSFERVFDLADYVEVTGAYMGDGLLIIELKRELPEALKPKQIPIASAPMKHIPARLRRDAARPWRNLTDTCPTSVAKQLLPPAVSFGLREGRSAGCRPFRNMKGQ